MCNICIFVYKYTKSKYSKILISVIVSSTQGSLTNYHFVEKTGLNNKRKSLSKEIGYPFGVETPFYCHVMRSKVKDNNDI